MPPRPRFDRRAPVRELPNINDRISYPQLRVVDADGSQLGVITREAALEVAKDRELDLVLVSEKADPPVCRIMDYGKYKFEQEKKAKEAKKKSHQTEVKEVKMRYKIDQHDYDVRIGQDDAVRTHDEPRALTLGRHRLTGHQRRAEEAEKGILFWSQMYIPVIVAMSATQNVVVALDSGLLAIIAGIIPVFMCFACIPLLVKLTKSSLID